jgi:hypothetical protein
MALRKPDFVVVGEVDAQGHPRTLRSTGVLVAGLTLLALTAPATAAAQRSLALQVEGEVDAARTGVLAAAAARGLRVVPLTEEERCAEDCATTARSVGVDGVLALSDEALVLHLRDGTRHRVTLEGPGEDEGRGALVALLDAARESPRAFLRILGRGDVVIDGEPAGTAPLRRALRPGLHHVGEREVRLVPEREVTFVLGEEALEDRAAEPPAPVPVADEASEWNLILGGVLAVGGVLTLISPLATLTGDGTCVTALQDVCIEVVSFGPRSGVLLGAGVALLVAAVVFDAVQPIRRAADP